MKTQYEFRSKALAFAKNEGFDSVRVSGIYGDYEVYIPYCKRWKNNSPVIGLPQFILVNENEVLFGNPLERVSVFMETRKLPSVIFEYDRMCWYGNSYNIKLLSDGTLIRIKYGYSKLGPEHRMCDDSEEVILVNPSLAEEIKRLIKVYKDKLKGFPKDLSNHDFFDGPFETVRLGKMKFSGSNIFTEHMAESFEHSENHENTDDKSYELSLCEFHKIYSEFKSVINKYCSGFNIWQGFNEED